MTIRKTRALATACFSLLAASSATPRATAANYNLIVDAAVETGVVNRFWQESIGADHLYTVLGSGEGTTAQSAYRLAADELGMKTVRGHGILNDDVGIYREVNGQPVYSWDNYDKIMDYILSLGMKPLVELSFMPKDLASGTATFGWYNGYPGNITPPKNYDRWQALIYNIAKHSIERYGLAEVESWYWEVWNEPDLPDFFTGSQQDYFQLYDRAAAGLMQASPSLKVGGPSVAIISNGWIGALVDHCMSTGVKIDFVSWHKYPYPDDARALNIADGNSSVTSIIEQKEAQYPGLDLKNFLTEWNSSFKGGDSFNNEMGASFVAKAVHAMFQDQSGVAPPDRTAFWVISDVWEEWDSRASPAFDVMGLVMRKHDVKKPSYLAFQMLAMMHSRQLAFTGGTSAETGLNGFATLSANGKDVRVLVYNHHHGDGEYATTVTDSVTLEVKNLPFQKTNVEVERFGVDRDNNNAFRVWDSAGRPTAPSEELWQQMKAAGELDAIEPKQLKPLSSAGITLSFDQLQPGVSLVTITEEGASPFDPPPGTGGAGGSGGYAQGAGGVSSTGGVSGSVGTGGLAAGAAAAAGASAGSTASPASGQALPARGCGCRTPATQAAATSAPLLGLWLPLLYVWRRARRRVRS